MPVNNAIGADYLLREDYFGINMQNIVPIDSLKKTNKSMDQSKFFLQTACVYYGINE